MVRGYLAGWDGEVDIDTSHVTLYSEKYVKKNQHRHHAQQKITGQHLEDCQEIFCPQQLQKSSCYAGTRVWRMHVVSMWCMAVLLGRFPRYQSPRPQRELCMPGKWSLLCWLHKNRPGREQHNGKRQKVEARALEAGS